MDEDRFETGRTALTEELVREVEAEKLEVASLQQALQKAKHEARKIDSNRNM
jgi:molybdopterin-guanine dinucleotide biosynthesis protein